MSERTQDFVDHPPGSCNEPSCERGGKLTRGMCSKHYRYWLDHTPPAQRGLAPKYARRFWDFVDKSGACWVWTGPTNAQGYGLWSGRVADGRKGLAHRLALAEAVECPDVRLLACHRCDNPPCVNPAHLYWGTERDNSRDAVERGQFRNGSMAKTHCKNGHPLAGDNLLIVGRRKARQCRICVNNRNRIAMRAAYARKKAARAVAS